MTMVRQGRRGLVTVTASACTALLLAGLAGCGNDAEAEAEESPRFELPTATPTPEVTEPPWETDLTLSSAEKKAVDEAYRALTNLLDAHLEVATEGGKNDERVLRFTRGKMYEVYASDYEYLRSSGESVSGHISHRYHKVDEVNLGDGANSTSDVVVFISCIDFSKYRVVDTSGESVLNDDVEPFEYRYTLDDHDADWKLVNTERTGVSCS